MLTQAMEICKTIFDIIKKIIVYIIVLMGFKMDETSGFTPTNNDDKETIMAPENYNEIDFWDTYQSVLDSNEENISPLAEGKSVPKLRKALAILKMTRGYVTKKNNNMVIHLNTNIHTVPQIIVTNIDPYTESEIVTYHNQQGVTQTIKTLLGQVTIAPKILAETIMATTSNKYYQLCPQVYVSKKPIRKLTKIYGVVNQTSEAHMCIKSRTNLHDYFVTTQVHMSTYMDIKENGRFKKETTNVVVLVPSDKDFIIIGSLVEVNNLPYIAWATIELPSIDHVIVIAAALINHDFEYMLDLIVGERI